MKDNLVPISKGIIDAATRAGDTSSLLELVPEENREQTLKLTKALLEARQLMGVSILKQGRILAELRDILKGNFYRYVGGIPGYSTATVTRYIATWENGKDLLPEPILAAALSAGIDMVSYDKRKPFGKFTTIVRKMPIPANVTPESAETYIRTIATAQKIAAKKAAPDRPAVNFGDERRKCFQFVYRSAMRLKEKDRETMLNEIVPALYSAVGVTKTVHITPEAPNDELMLGMNAPKGRPTKEKAAPKKKVGRKPKTVEATAPPEQAEPAA